MGPGAAARHQRDRDQLVADIQELADGVAAPDFVVDPIQWPAAPRHCSTRSPAPRSPARRTSSRTPTCTTSRPTPTVRSRDRVAGPILDDRNPELAARIDQRFADLDAELAQFRQGDGFVSYETVTEPQRQALSQKIDALSAEVSQVQGVVAGQ